MSDKPAPMFVEDGQMLVLIGEAEGAIPNGTRIVKSEFREGDTHPIGAVGTVFSSVALPDDMREEFPGIDFMYWIVWDDLPEYPIATSGDKIGLA